MAEKCQHKSGKILYETDLYLILQCDWECKMVHILIKNERTGYTSAAVKKPLFSDLKTLKNHGF